MSTPEVMTADEAIAMAMLLGCTFWDNGRGIWYMVSADPDDKSGYHPVELDCLQAWEKQDVHTRPIRWGWTSREMLAHDYIKWWRVEHARPEAIEA